MKLTQEEKRIKLAEAAGWRLFSQFKNLWAPPKHVVEYDCDAYPLPDYFNDLNAVHELEKVLTDEQWLEYREELRTFSLGPIRLISQWCKADIHATAAQRCEAIGLALKLW